MLLSNLKKGLGLALIAFVLSLAADRANAAPIIKEGVPGNEVQLHVNDDVNNGYMPVYVKGYVINGKAYFDFAWQVADGSTWELRHMIADSDWQHKDNDLRTLGYTRACSNFYFVGGRKFHSTLWRKSN
jgi:hypothetical protein